MTKRLLSVIIPILAFAVISTAAVPPPATNTPPPIAIKELGVTTESEPYAAGQFGLSYFASYRAHEFGAANGRLGYGPELSYAFTKPFTLAIEGLTENPQHAFFDEAGINGKFYVPISTSGLSFYALLGYTRRFEDLTGVVTREEACKNCEKSFSPEGEGKNRGNFGLGLELRGKKDSLLGFATPKGFADGRWTTDFRVMGQALFRLGAGFDF